MHYRLAGEDVATLLQSLQNAARNRLAEVERVADLDLTRKDQLEPVTRQELRDAPAETRLPCAAGGRRTSRMAVERPSGRGRWLPVSDKDLQKGKASMILRQYLHDDPQVAASYLLGCGSREAGAVVDPVEAPRLYLDEAERLGLRIRYVIDTHVHADHAHPRWRGSAVGVYRFWRDSGYAVGAVIAGVLADRFGITAAIAVVAALTFISGLLVAARMPETLPRPAPSGRVI